MASPERPVGFAQGRAGTWRHDKTPPLFECKIKHKEMITGAFWSLPEAARLSIIHAYSRAARIRGVTPFIQNREGFL